MINQSTIDKLIEMRLSSMADAFRIQMNDPSGYTGALKAPVRCFGNHLSGKGKSSFQTDNECGGVAILKK